jgi:hypothetical protein
MNDNTPDGGKQNGVPDSDEQEIDYTIRQYGLTQDQAREITKEASTLSSNYWDRLD